MKRNRIYHNPGRYGAILGGAALLIVAISAAHAQSAIEISSTSNGGDLHKGGYGEIYSTIGEPVANDSANTVDNATTWTGFWQIVPVGPVAGVHEERGPVSTLETSIASSAPDPFSAELRVTVSLARPGNVRLILFDIMGRPVGTLVDGQREAGTLRLTWQPEGLGAGSYFLQLLVDGQSRGTRPVHYYR